MSDRAYCPHCGGIFCKILVKGKWVCGVAFSKKKRKKDARPNR